MRLVFTYLLVMLSSLAYTQTARDLVRTGNENYEIDSLTTAISNYEEASKLDPKLEEAKFNLGDAFYKQGKFADASSTFDELAKSTSSTEMKTNAFYNQGNSLMEMQKFEEAMNAYKNAMKANPKNQNARYNYEFARKQLAEQKKQEQQNKDDKDKEDENKDDKKDEKNKNKKDQDKDGKNDKNKDEDQDKNKDKDKDKQDQDKKDDQKDKGDKDKEDQNKEDEKKDGDKNEDKGDKDQEKPQNQQPQPSQMSKADAERLLKAMEENEKKTREKVALQKARVKSKKKSDKDW